MDKPVMIERPILFSGPMVRAILAGAKTQTRRVVKSSNGTYNAHGISSLFRCPYGQPGDRLWVREGHAIVPRTAYACSDGVQQVMRPGDTHDAAIFREGWERSSGGIRWRPSIHMPRWASRITLEVTGVRVERLQDISEGDARAEGAPDEITRFGMMVRYPSKIMAFMELWDEINFTRAPWASNPWVWVISFERCT